MDINPKLKGVIGICVVNRYAMLLNSIITHQNQFFVDRAIQNWKNETK